MTSKKWKKARAFAATLVPTFGGGWKTLDGRFTFTKAGGGWGVTDKKKKKTYTAASLFDAAMKAGRN